MERHTIIVSPFERSGTKMRKIYNKMYGQNHKLPIQRIELIFHFRYKLNYWSVIIDGNLDQFIEFIQNYVIFDASHMNTRSTFMIYAAIHVNNILDIEFIKEIPIYWTINNKGINGWFSGVMLKTNLKYELQLHDGVISYNESDIDLLYNAIDYVINNCSNTKLDIKDIDFVAYNKKRTDQVTIDLNNKMILGPSVRLGVINFSNTIRKLCIKDITNITDTSIVFPNLTSFEIGESIDSHNKMKLFEEFLNNNKTIYKFKVNSINVSFYDTFVSNKIIKYLVIHRSFDNLLIQLLSENTTLEKIKIIHQDNLISKIPKVCDNFRGLHLNWGTMPSNNIEKIITSNIVDTHFRVACSLKEISDIIEKHQGNVILAEILINPLYLSNVYIDSHDKKRMKRLLTKQKTLQYLCDDETSIYQKYTQYKPVTN